MNNNYFFIDGSSLTAQIRQLQRKEKIYQGRKLCPRKFIDFWVHTLGRLHGNSYRRATFYFPRGDEAGIEDFIIVPDYTVPGEVEDMHFKFCGQKLKKSAAFAKFVEEQVPPEFLDRFQKSEKGVDTEICCDALRLASTDRLERLFLLSNDSDFIPLCRTLKDFGANISILHLSAATLPNGDMLREADTYHVVSEERLSGMFLPIAEPIPVDAEPASELSSAEQEASTEKEDDSSPDENASPLGEAAEFDGGADEFGDSDISGDKAH